jgi:CubicO group peptidase (beta-lactamase class C family)
MHTNVSRVRPASASREGVTSDNWCDAPFNRWGFWHVRELARTALVSRGNGPVWRLPERAGAFRGFMFDDGDDTYTLTEALQASYTDAMVVLHRGEVVFEWYDRLAWQDCTHLVMSVSKSFTSTLIGALVGDLLLDLGRDISQYVPELRGTAWEGATVQHLLDMSAGVRFDEEDYDNPESDGRLIEQVSGYTTHRRPDLPADTADWILGLAGQGAHGDRFQYRSIITDVLAMVVEAVTGRRFAEVFSERIWQRIGAERDADLIVDAKGFPTVEGGFCVTARDLARLGQMHLQRGAVGGRQVITEAWADHVLRGDDTLRRHFDMARDGNPHEYYHDCWWVFDAALGRYAGHGINGQHLVIDRTTETVIAQMSTWPQRLDPHLMRFGNTLLMEMLTHLG